MVRQQIREAPAAVAPRVLLLQGQSVYDPSSGAAQSMRQIAESLAWSGCEVQSLCTTGCENGLGLDHWQRAMVRGQAMPPDGFFEPAPGRWLSGRDHGVTHHALVTDPARRHHWVSDHGAAFDDRFDQLLLGFRPHIVLTFGSDASDHRRWALARHRHAGVVLMLHNLHQTRLTRPQVDAIWVPSRFMARRYEQAWGREAKLTVVPTPLGPMPLKAAPAEAAAQRVFVTFINPEPAKGVDVVAGVLQRWLGNRPQQPLLIVEGRAGAAEWRTALAARGVAASQCDQVFVSPVVSDLSGVWAASRVVLMPSLVEEAAGRVALEAMRHGVVPVVSDRGALPETVVESTWVQALPSSLTWQESAMVDEDSCARWDRAISHWLDDAPAWEVASAQARGIAERHAVEQVAPVYRRALAPLLQAGSP